MRAFAVRNFGEAPALYDLPIPGAAGAFLIRVTYAGINPLDDILVKQLTATSQYPFVLGVDFAAPRLSACSTRCAPHTRTASRLSSIWSTVQT